jgi:radical SAM protein with 4Fe4S-binding SPASM domain
MIKTSRKRVKLYTFVKKVKGKKNWVLEDLFRKKLFRITPEGSVEDLKESLIKANLAYETEGSRPHEFELNLSGFEENVKLRRLQIRVTGNCNFECDDCGELCTCFKGGGEMTGEILSELLQQIQYIPIDHILITGGNPLLRPRVLEQIKEESSAHRYSIVFKRPGDLNTAGACDQLGFNILTSAGLSAEIREEKMQVNQFMFFYSRKYNSCWGHSIAVDANGDIKPCLWSHEVLGNITVDNIKKMILQKKFKEYWELNKDNIETCQYCEYRYACPDCRVSAIKAAGSLHVRPPHCKYNPDTGEWNI